jgi:hypothetical protein
MKRMEKEQQSGNIKTSFRDTEFWLPDVPGKHLLLNSLPKTYSWEFTNHRPCNILLFGGSQGELLPHLIGIAACVTDDDFICGFEFLYEGNSYGIEKHSLGISKEPHRDHRPHEFQKHKFSLDGPGKERIETVEVQIKWGGMRALKVCFSKSFGPFSTDQNFR